MQDRRLKLLLEPREIDPQAWKQIETALQRPWLRALAIMPDVHMGYDLPIGAVALTEGIISPSFVGYDIGCGMNLLYLNRSLAQMGLESLESRQRLHAAIKKRIPMGTGQEHGKPPAYPEPFTCACGDSKLAQSVTRKADAQYGTLGGGNHFIELGVSTDKRNTALVIHSGSRNPGHSIAEYYMKRQRYIPLEEPLGQAYLADLEWALGFALANRLSMMRQILAVMGFGPDEVKSMMRGIENENHNAAELREDGLVLHRKGATPAKAGQIGVIPGSMKTGCYVTEGLGNPEYLESASHGAGRRLSRKQAKKQLSLKDFKASMQGIVADVSPATLDESPAAYKDLDWVIARQDGINIRVIDHLSPVISIKGV